MEYYSGINVKVQICDETVEEWGQSIVIWNYDWETPCRRPSIIFRSGSHSQIDLLGNVCVDVFRLFGFVLEFPASHAIGNWEL